MDYKYTSFEWAKSTLPNRKTDGNKGSFGKLFMYVGSETYMGAAHIALEAALRGGAGYVEVGAAGELKKTLLSKFPEAIYKEFGEASSLKEQDVERLITAQRGAASVLVGCGCSKSSGLFKIVESLLCECGGVMVLDADAINSMAENRESALALLKKSPRRVILTPHPMEFSRLTGLGVDYINENRMECSIAFAKEYGCTLVLKGKGTVITDGDNTYINTSGSSALAKAGSGDALAGILSSLAASTSLSPIEVSALSVYVHGKAGDNLASVYSEYGVTPSDLPKEMARVLSVIENKN